MRHFSSETLTSMREALNNGSFYFSEDPENSQKISASLKLLDGGRKDMFERIADFVCNLHLIAIAETGFDLNKRPYFSRHPNLPARYIVAANTVRGREVIEMVRKQHPSAIVEFKR